MKFTKFAPPEPFARSPLLVLLPIRGKVGRLESLTSSLYARYENIVQVKRAVEDGDDPKVGARIAAEESMLRIVLEWLQVEPDKVAEISLSESKP